MRRRGAHACFRMLHQLVSHVVGPKTSCAASDHGHCCGAHAVPLHMRGNACAWPVCTANSGSRVDARGKRACGNRYRTAAAGPVAVHQQYILRILIGLVMALGVNAATCAAEQCQTTSATYCDSTGLGTGAGAGSCASGVPDGVCSAVLQGTFPQVYNGYSPWCAGVPRCCCCDVRDTSIAFGNVCLQRRCGGRVLVSGRRSKLGIVRALQRRHIRGV